MSKEVYVTKKVGVERNEGEFRTTKSLFVSFPCNIEAVCEQLGAQSAEALFFPDRPDSKWTVVQYNEFIKEIPERLEALDDLILTKAVYVKNKYAELEKNGELASGKGVIEELKLSFKDSLAWHLAYKDGYTYKGSADEKLQVWKMKDTILIRYGDKTQKQRDHD